jgi:hypothetical protein
MKANEAPEKIYMNWVNYPLEEIQVEYTRTDAFINKACEWLENNLQGIVGGSIYMEDFRKYMKGE